MSTAHPRVERHIVRLQLRALKRFVSGILGLALVIFSGTLSAQPVQLPPPPLGNPPIPAGNPQTPAKIALGLALFWEEQLSLTGTVACGTCHRPSAGGGDPRSLFGGAATTHPGPDRLLGSADDIRASAGVPRHFANGDYHGHAIFGVTPQVGIRDANSVYMSAHLPNLLFWDGRVGGVFVDPLSGQTLLASGGALENQALEALLNTAEMAHEGATASSMAALLESARPLALAQDIPAAVASWIGTRDYPALFGEVFGSPQVTPARIALAIASYQRSLNPNQAPLDLLNGSIAGLTELEQQGLLMIRNNSCESCHGAVVPSSAFAYIGVRPVDDDLGRFNVTGVANDRGAFRIPSLRNVELSAPYMHNGAFSTLEEVVEFYGRGGNFTAPNRDGRIQLRNWTAAQKAALVAYLKRPLTDPRIAAESGPFARPTLYTESARVPVIVSGGRPGSGGIEPSITALEPPLVGNPNFTAVLSGALANTAAHLVVSGVDPGIQSALPIGDFARISVQTSVNGVASAQVHLPGPPGRVLFGRFYVEDAAAANALAVTPAFRITLFGGSGDALLSNGFE